MLGLEPLADQVAVGVDDAARLAGGARGEDDQRRVLGVHRPRPRPASPAAGPRRGPAATSSMSIVGHAVGQLGQAARPRRRRASGRAAATRSSRSLRRSCVLQGSATAPIRQQASSVSTHSIRLPTSVITTSPRRTPRAAKAPESPAERANSSPKWWSRRSPSASTSISARPRGRESLHHVLDEVHGRGSLPQPQPSAGGQRSSQELLPSSCRATISSWICWVPSKMSRIFASRAHFSSSSFSP